MKILHRRANKQPTQAEAMQKCRELFGALKATQIELNGALLVQAILIDRTGTDEITITQPEMVNADGWYVVLGFNKAPRNEDATWALKLVKPPLDPEVERMQKLTPEEFDAEVRAREAAETAVGTPTIVPVSEEPTLSSDTPQSPPTAPGDHTSTHA